MLKNRGRGHVVVVVEPSVAALLFYGVCRLLPESLTVYSDQAAGISFSTYEPFPERPMTNLVATTFFDIDNPTNDLPPEVYQRGFACNTFRQPFKCLKDGRALSRSDSYAQHILRLATDGHALTRDHADEHELLRTLNGLTNLNVSMLDQLVELDRSLAEYIHGVRPWAEVSRTTKSPTAGPEAEFLRKRFRTMLEAGARKGQTEWPPDLLQRAVEWLGDELVAEDGLWNERHPESYRVLAGMLPTTDAALKEFISPKSARQPPDQVVVEAVVGVAHRGHKIPDCLGDFLKERENAGRTQATPPFFQTIVERLDKNQLPGILLNSNPEIHADRILSAITSGGCGLPKPIVAELLEKLLGKVLDDSVPAAARWRLLAAHSNTINLLDRPVRPELQDRLSRHFSGTSPQSGLRNEPPAVTSSDGLQSLDFWAGLTTQFSENELLLRSWREFYKGFNKLKEKVKASQGKGFAWGGVSKAIREDVAVVADSLCKIKGLRSCADMEKHHAAQCIGLFRSVLKAKESGVTAEASKQLDELMQQHLDAQMAAREKSKSRSYVAANGKPSGRPRWAVAAAVVIVLLGGGGALTLIYRPKSPSKSTPDTVASDDRQGKGNRDNGSQPHKPGAVKGEGNVEGQAGLDNNKVTAPPGPALPPEAPAKVSAEDIKLRLEEIKDGKLIVNWHPGVSKKGACELTGSLRKENGETKEFKLSINAEKPPCQISLYDYGYGTYSLVFKVTPAKPGKVFDLKSPEVPFPRPKSASIESLRLVIPDTNTPELIARIKVDDKASRYGKPVYSLRATRGKGEQVGEVVATSTVNQDIHFTKLPDKLLPNDFLTSADQRVTFRVLMTPPGTKPGELSVESMPAEATFDAGGEIATFMKRQVDGKTVLNTKGVFPLKPISRTVDALDVPLVRLPSLLQDVETELILLTPKWPWAEGARGALKLDSASPAANERVWLLLEEPAVTNKADIFPTPSQQPLKCGEFYVDRKVWQSELRFRQTGTDQPITDALVRLSYCKLGVIYRPRNGIPRVVALMQLREPIAHNGGTIAVTCDSKDRKSIALPAEIPKLVSHPKIDFRPPPPATNGPITAACNGKQLSLSVNDKVLAIAGVEVSPEKKQLLLKQFEWAEPDPAHTPEFVGLPFKKGDVLSLIVRPKIPLAMIKTEFEHSRCGVKDSATRKDYYDKLGLTSKQQPLLSPEELLRHVEAVVVDDKASDDYRRYVSSCIDRSRRLVKRYETFGAFVKEVQDKTFKFAPWSIEWPVEFPAGAAIPKGEDNYESVGGLVVKAIVCSDSEKAAEAAPVPAKADAPATAK
jgi:hypothetical protein